MLQMAVVSSLHSSKAHLCLTESFELESPHIHLHARAAQSRIAISAGPAARIVGGGGLCVSSWPIYPYLDVDRLFLVKRVGRRQIVLHLRDHLRRAESQRVERRLLDVRARRRLVERVDSLSRLESSCGAQKHHICALGSRAKRRVHHDRVDGAVPQREGGGDICPDKVDVGLPFDSSARSVSDAT